MTEARSKAFYYTRVALLLSVLVIVVLYAAQDVYRRRRRNAWDHTLDVALIVVRRGPVDPKAIAAMRERLPALEAKMASELRRRRPGAPRPFRIQFFGPVDVDGKITLPTSDGLFARAQELYSQWRDLRAIDERAEVHAAAFDSRVYVSVRPPQDATRKLVEGASEENGRVATVEIELAEDTVDLALFVSAHELLHTLGATDKYDSLGQTKIPEGLAEPDARPRFPQRFAEIMARNRVLAEGKEKIPTSLDELAVGNLTAREIGWTTP